MYAIIQLTAENFMGLKAVSISPDGNVVEITGPNGAGKSSVLRAIWAALGGKDAFPKKPIRDGEDSAMVRLVLGEDGKPALKVRLKFIGQEDGSFTHSLIVENGEGARFNSPQKMLDKLVGALSFDPLAFANAKPAAQMETLKQFVVGVDLDDLAAKNADDFKTRTDINRRAKAERVRADAIDIPAGAPKARIDDKALLDEYANAGAGNAKIAQRAENRRQAKEEAETKTRRARDLFDEVAALRQKADEAEKQAVALGEEAKEIKDDLADAPALPEPVDLTDLRKRIDEAAEANRRFDAAAAARQQQKALSESAAALEAESAALTARMEERDKAKAAAIAKAKMPIKGLGFGADEITLDDVPFSQVNAAAKLRASVAIAAALNPDLRVLRVEQGVLLDKAGFKQLAALAKEMNMQVWCETVESGRPAAIEIRDGEVAS